MKIVNTKSYYVMHPTKKKDSEGNTITAWDSNKKYKISGYVYHVSGMKAAEQYGDRLAYMYKMLCDADHVPFIENKQIKYHIGDNILGVSDGLCIYGKDVDFVITAIQEHGHLEIELEMVH